MTSFKHHFLVAMPILKDSTFGRSVVYVYEHTLEGAMGLIINKPMPIALGKVLRHLKIDISSEAIDNQLVYMGGPVGQEQGFILYEEKKDEGTQLVLSTSKDLLTSIANGKDPSRYLVALGYAGWEPGQLEYEINTNDWLVTPYHASILFDVAVDQRWQEAAKLLGINIHHLTEQIGHA